MNATHYLNGTEVPTAAPFITNGTGQFHKNTEQSYSNVLLWVLGKTLQGIDPNGDDPPIDPFGTDPTNNGTGDNGDGEGLQ